MRRFLRLSALTGLLVSLAGCGNGGSINFTNPAGTPEVTINKPSAFSFVPASQALVVESGQTVSTGYHGKLQMNPLHGQSLSGPGGYKAKMKFTARNR